MDEANVDSVNEMPAGLQLGIFSLLLNLCPSPFPPSLTLRVDLTPVTVANLGWQIVWRESRWKETKVGGKGKKLYIQNFPQSLQEPFCSPEGLVLFPQGGRVWPLYVSWFRKVGDESYHHPDIHTGAYSDGEGSQEQGPSWGDVSQREVTFIHRLGGLEKKGKTER